MGRPRKPEKTVLSAPARAWFTKSEYAQLGRYARVNGKTVSTLIRAVVLAAMAAERQQAA